MKTLENVSLTKLQEKFGEDFLCDSPEAINAYGGGFNLAQCEVEEHEIVTLSYGFRQYAEESCGGYPIYAIDFTADGICFSDVFPSEDLMMQVINELL